MINPYELKWSPEKNVRWWMCLHRNHVSIRSGCVLHEDRRGEGRGGLHLQCHLAASPYRQSNPGRHCRARFGRSVLPPSLPAYLSLSLSLSLLSPCLKLSLSLCHSLIIAGFHHRFVLNKSFASFFGHLRRPALMLFVEAKALRRCCHLPSGSLR